MGQGNSGSFLSLLLKTVVLKVMLTINIFVVFDVFEDGADIAVVGALGKEEVFELLGVEISPFSDKGQPVGTGC
jgi:hypothetical protein